ncbi:hypothetical protein PS870_03730 [Pseudomonas fluorescens]|jgi:hypothetical protein|uniref:Uncharacterized protein n=1 Tax=Pseudomonas fluorescens TaxID=294 RepID=A0A5E7M501_PSEFL|nr:hypothetical protein PS870_03730 [Pseudomonas fluorescens]
MPDVRFCPFSSPQFSSDVVDSPSFVKLTQERPLFTLFIIDDPSQFALVQSTRKTTARAGFCRLFLPRIHRHSPQPWRVWTGCRFAEKTTYLDRRCGGGTTARAGSKSPRNAPSPKRRCGDTSEKVARALQTKRKPLTAACRWFHGWLTPARFRAGTPACQLDKLDVLNQGNQAIVLDHIGFIHRLVIS